MLRTSRKLTIRSAAFSVLLLAFIVGFGSSVAQNEATGTVEAVVNGEARTWYTGLFAAEETGQPTATWSNDMFPNFSIQAHPELHFSVEGALAIEFWAFEFPSDCPCVFPDSSVLLWNSSSMFENVYQTDEATGTITSLEPLGDDVYALEGSFTANLAFQASIYDEPDLTDTLTMEGTFSIATLPRDDLLD